MTVHLSKKDKKQLVDLLKSVDVKTLEIDHPDERIVKWFRFGSFNGLAIACEIIKALPEESNEQVQPNVR
jgi:hypothetical protein